MKRTTLFLFFAIFILWPHQSSAQGYPAVNGKWSGKWYSIHLYQEGPVTVVIRQSGPTLWGTVNLPESTCQKRFPFTGSVGLDGTITMSASYSCSGLYARFTVHGGGKGKFMGAAYGQLFRGQWVDFGSITMRKL